MTLQSDGSVGIVKESTYGTAVVVTRFPEYTDASFTQENEYVQGEGLRVGKVIARSSRRSLGKVVSSGSFEAELPTKGFGPFWEAALGSGTSTLRSGVIYQQNYVPLTTDPMPCYTIQTGVPPIGGGTTIAQTFVGSVCDSWELSAEAGGIAMFKSDWVAKEMLTATAYATPSYVASPKIFTFTHLSVSIGVNGTDTLTVPTTTALGTTSKAALTSITKFSVKGENKVDDGGYTAGGAGKRVRRPVYGLREIMGSLTAEFIDTTLRDYYLAQSSLHIVATFTSDDPITGGAFATCQVVIPACVLEGSVPTSNSGDIIEQDIDFTVLDGESAASPFYVVHVTADIAI